MQNNKERRRYRRIGLQRSVDIVWYGGIYERYLARDFSMMGLCIQSDSSHETGEIMQVNLQISPQGKPVELEVQGEVKYCTYCDGQYLTGLEFNRRSATKSRLKQ